MNRLIPFTLFPRVQEGTNFMRGGKRTIWVVWGWTNGCGLLLGTLLHMLFAHPAAGASGASRVFLNKLLLSATVFALCLLQQGLLQIFTRVGWRDVLFQTTLTVSAFWIGFYATQVPCHHFAISSIAGLAAGFLSRHRPGEWRRWMWLSTIGFLLSAGAELIALPSSSVLTWAIDNVTAFNDFGLFAGVASTAMTAGQLIRTLHASPMHPLPPRSLQPLLG